MHTLKTKTKELLPVLNWHSVYILFQSWCFMAMRYRKMPVSVIMSVIKGKNAYPGSQTGPTLGDPAVLYSVYTYACWTIHRLANKQDKPEALDEVDICELLNLETVVNTNKCPCRIVSHTCLCRLLCVWDSCEPGFIISGTRVENL